MPTIEISNLSPQLLKSVRPDIMKALDARPEFRLVFTDATCCSCGAVMPGDGRIHYEHHANPLAPLSVCPSCEARLRAWKAGAYCHECGALLTDGEKEHNSEDTPLCTDCADNWTHCAECDKHVPKDETDAAANGDAVCGDCGIAEYTTCCCCEELVKNGNVVGDYNNAPLCQSCYDDDFFTCEQCGRIHRIDDGHICTALRAGIWKTEASSASSPVTSSGATSLSS